MILEGLGGGGETIFFKSSPFEKGENYFQVRYKCFDCFFPECSIYYGDSWRYASGKSCTSQRSLHWQRRVSVNPVSLVLLYLAVGKIYCFVDNRHRF